jgi:hypothetical protein
MTDASSLTDAERGELEFLRRRVAELESERMELIRRTTEAVASAQRRAYWLDRWHVDLNALMARSSAARLRGTARALRAPLRAGRTVKRRLLGR